MRKMKNFVVLALAIGGLLITQALFAQQGQQGQQQDVEKKPEQAQTTKQSQEKPEQPQATSPSPETDKSTIEKQARVNNIVGKKVISQKGEDLGTVQDLVLNQDGCLDYLILGHGGLLGIGDRLIPIPWKTVKTGTKADTVIVDVDKEQLMKAPSFESKKWPDLSDSEWYGKVKEFFGTKQ